MNEAAILRQAVTSQKRPARAKNTCIYTVHKYTHTQNIRTRIHSYRPRCAAVAAAAWPRIVTMFPRPELARRGARVLGTRFYIFYRLREMFYDDKAKSATERVLLLMSVLVGDFLLLLFHSVVVVAYLLHYNSRLCIAYIVV